MASRGVLGHVVYRLARKTGFKASGTLANAVIVGLCINATVWLVPAQHNLAWQASMLVACVVLNGLATGLYIGAGFGPGQATA
jgi:uncharacterized membrane protein YczE